MSNEPVDPRHQVIIDLVRSYRDLGHDKKADALKEQAANLETFEQLDALSLACKRILRFLDS